jgi:hypothetical protein
MALAPRGCVSTEVVAVVPDWGSDRGTGTGCHISKRRNRGERWTVRAEPENTDLPPEGVSNSIVPRLWVVAGYSWFSMKDV